MIAHFAQISQINSQIYFQVPPKSKPQRKKLSTGSSKVQSGNTSGRTSSMSLHSNPSVFRSSRKISSGGGAVNCTGPGDIAQYVKYVKSGGFVPLPILEPERGVEASLFALNPGTIWLFDG